MSTEEFDVETTHAEPAAKEAEASPDKALTKREKSPAQSHRKDLGKTSSEIS